MEFDMQVRLRQTFDSTPFDEIGKKAYTCLGDVWNCHDAQSAHLDEPANRFRRVRRRMAGGDPQPDLIVGHQCGWTP